MTTKNSVKLKISRFFLPIVAIIGIGIFVFFIYDRISSGNESLLIQHEKDRYRDYAIKITQEAFFIRHPSGLVFAVIVYNRTSTISVVPTDQIHLIESQIIDIDQAKE